MLVTPHIAPLSDANRLGLDYRLEALKLPWSGRVIDGHIHINSVKAGRTLMEVARVFGVERFWSQSQLEDVDALRGEFGDKFEFIAVPNYAAKARDETFTTDWFKRLDAFREKGVKIAKFWGAPRGRDFHPSILLDHPTRLAAMKHAKSLGMALMFHVADPDTWFLTHYKDAQRYGTKASHYEVLERILDEYADTPCLAAHLAGDPEHLDHLQGLLDRHANLYMDISATKWMVRELSRQPERFAQFCRDNPGRLMWGTDNVVADAGDSFELYASRYWSMRALMETDYQGMCPIVDPDLCLVDPTLPSDSTAAMHGARLDPATLEMLYYRAAEGFAKRIHGL